MDERQRIETVFAAHGDRAQRELIAAHRQDAGFLTHCRAIATGPAAISCRRWAFEACAAVAGRANAQLARGGLADPAMTIRLHTLCGIARSGMRHRLAWLAACLDDPSGGIRCNAVEVLAEAQPALLRRHAARLRRDPKAYIRQRIERFLLRGSSST